MVTVVEIMMTVPMTSSSRQVQPHRCANVDELAVVALPFCVHNHSHIASAGVGDHHKVKSMMMQMMMMMMMMMLMMMMMMQLMMMMMMMMMMVEFLEESYLNHRRLAHAWNCESQGS